jgi:hypothetical protein
VDLAVEADLSVGRRHEHLLSPVGVWRCHLAGVDDHPVHPKFGTAERLRRPPNGCLIRFIVSQYRWIAETGGRSTGEQLQ